jgi:hypothetical protein
VRLTLLNKYKHIFFMEHRIQSRFRDNLQERIALKVIKPKQCENQM